MIKTEQLTVDGHSMPLHVGIPAGEGPHPAMLLMYHRYGYDDFTRGRQQALMDAGYLTVVPEMFFRAPAGHTDPKSFLTDDIAIAAIKATAAYVEAQPLAAPGKMAIIGHCMGGRLSFQGAINLPQLKAAAVFYGGGMFVSWGHEGAPPFAHLKTIRCPVIGFFGNLDKNPSPEDVNKIDAELTKHGIPHVFHRYADVGHGFQQGKGGMPGEKAASDDAWAKMLAFMADKLKGATPARMVS